MKMNFTAKGSTGPIKMVPGIRINRMVFDGQLNSYTSRFMQIANSSKEGKVVKGMAHLLK